MSAAIINFSIGLDNLVVDTELHSHAHGQSIYLGPTATR